MKIFVKGRKCEIKDVFPNEVVWLRDTFTFTDEFSGGIDEAIWDLCPGQYYAASGMALQIMERAKDLSDIEVEIIDPDNSLDVDFDVEIAKKVDANIFESIQLRDYQVAAVKKAVTCKEGMIESPTGSGKTEIIFAILSILFKYDRVKKALIVAPDVFLTKQLYDRGTKRGFSKSDMGIVQAENNDASKIITIATIDSLSSRYHSGKEDIVKLMEEVDIVIWDECHHLQSNSNREMLFAAVNAKYILGLSASPFSAKSPEAISDMVLLSLVKRVIFRLEQSYLIEKGYVARPIVHFKSVGGQIRYRNLPYNRMYKDFVVANKQRNDIITKYALAFRKYRLQCLILVTQKNHGIELLKSINSPDCIAMFGGSEQLTYEEGVVHSRLCDYEMFKRRFESGEINIVVATQVFDEGVDLCSIGAFINAAAGKSYRKTVQRMGRGMRKKDGMNCLFVVDFCDRTHVVLYNQYKTRKSTYLEIGSSIYNDEYAFFRMIHKDMEIRTSGEGLSCDINSILK